jgi:hypothetical protein
VRLGSTILILLGLHVSNAFAQSPDAESAVRSWFTASRAAARQIHFGAPVVVEYRIEFPNIVDDATLAKWRKDVEGKPFHPLRPEIEAADRRKTNGPDVERYRLWWKSNQEWRLCTDTASGYLDSVSSSRERWQLQNSSTLTLFDSAGPADPLVNSFNICKDDLSFILYQGLQLGPPEPLDLRIKVGPSDWEATFRSSNDWTWTLKGTWRRDDSWGLVTSIQERNPGSSTPTLVAELRGHRQIPELGAWIAASVDCKYGNTSRQLRFVSATKADNDAVRAVLVAPDALALNGSTDVIRGSVLPTRLNDYRTGHDTAMLLSPERTVMARDSLPRSGASSSSTQRLQLIGWIGAAALTAGLIAVRLWRRRTVP